MSVFCLISFCVDMYQIYLIHKPKPVGQKTLIASMVLDLGMFILAIIIMVRASNAQLKFCTQADNQVIFYTVSVIAVIRVLHLIVIIVYLLLVLPFLCCPNSCCMQALLRNKKASAKMVKSLDNWSWRYKKPSKHNQASFPTSCQICARDFERGETITFLPC